MSPFEELAHIYADVADIPPDIQHCLLIIAQAGCHPDQVKRWYMIVRKHFGADVEVDSPPGEYPLEIIRPPAPLPRALGTPTGPDSTGSQVSPSSVRSQPPFSIESSSASALGISSAVTQALMPPWMTPAISDPGFDPGRNSLPAPPLKITPSANPAHSPFVENRGMIYFTGDGTPSNERALFPASFSFAPDFPVFLPFEPQPYPSRREESSDINSGVAHEVRKRRKTSVSRTPSMAEPPKPRRRPSGHFHGDHSFPYTEVCPTSQRPAQVSRSPFTNPTNFINSAHPVLGSENPRFQMADQNQLSHLQQSSHNGQPGIPPTPDLSQQQQPPQFHTLSRQDSQPVVPQTPGLSQQQQFQHSSRQNSVSHTPELLQSQHLQSLSRRSSQPQLTNFSVSETAPSQRRAQQQQQPSPFMSQQIEHTTGSQALTPFATSDPPPYKSPYV